MKDKNVFVPSWPTTNRHEGHSDNSYQLLITTPPTSLSFPKPPTILFFHPSWIVEHGKPPTCKARPCWILCTRGGLLLPRVCRLSYPLVAAPRTLDTCPTTRGELYTLRLSGSCPLIAASARAPGAKYIISLAARFWKGHCLLYGPLDAVDAPIIRLFCRRITVLWFGLMAVLRVARSWGSFLRCFWLTDGI